MWNFKISEIIMYCKKLIEIFKNLINPKSVKKNKTISVNEHEWVDVLVDYSNHLKEMALTLNNKSCKKKHMIADENRKEIVVHDASIIRNNEHPKFKIGDTINNGYGNYVVKGFDRSILGLCYVLKGLTLTSVLTEQIDRQCRLVSSSPTKKTPKANIQNQQNPPLPKRKRSDGKGNSYVRVIVKDGGGSQIICKHLTENGAKAFINGISDLANKLGGTLVGNLKAIR